MKLSNKIFRLSSRLVCFTLVELLVVIGIMVILSGVTYVGVSEIRQTIRDSKRKADLHQLARALELFKTDYGQYPSNNHYSMQEYTGVDWEEGANETMMPFLVEGGELMLIYGTPSGPVPENTTVQGGYLDDYIKDPINQLNSWDAGDDDDNVIHHHVYLYWGPTYWVFDVTEWAFPWPLDCSSPTAPPPDDCGVENPNNEAATNYSNWDSCCGDCCFDCTFTEPYLSWNTTNQSGFSDWCYGMDSNRVLVLLAADLENESKPEERINNVLSFCPTASGTLEEQALFFNFKRYFYRGKDCYEGPGGGATSGASCDDGGGDWSSWGGNRHNYFVPLTGEYDLN